MADNRERDREAKRRAVPETLGSSTPHRAHSSGSAISTDASLQKIQSRTHTKGGGIVSTKAGARVEITGTSVPQSPLTEKKARRVTHTSGSSHVPTSHKNVGIDRKGRVEYAGMLGPGAHRTTVAPSAKKSKGAAGPSRVPRVESVGPMAPSDDTSTMVLGDKKVQAAGLPARTRRRSEDVNKKFIAGGRMHSNMPLVSEEIDINEPPPMPGTATAESPGMCHKTLAGLDRAFDLPESDRMVERQHENQYAFNSSNHGSRAVHGDEYKDEISDEGNTMRGFCSRYSKILICLTIVAIAVGVTVPLILSGGGGVEELGEAAEPTRASTPVPTLAPTAAPTPKDLSGLLPSASPTLAPSPSPTIEYTLPPTPTTEIEPGPPSTSTESWSVVGDAMNGRVGNEQFGTAVALSDDGKLVAASAPPANTRRGLVRVFQHVDNSVGWTRVGEDIHGDVQGERSGEVLALSGSGTTVAIASPEYSESGQTKVGKVRVYSWDWDVTSPATANWTLQGQPILGAAAGDEAGSSVALNEDGSMIVIGSPFYESNVYQRDHGRAQVFQFDAMLAKWNKLGEDIIGEVNNDQAGASVAMSASGHRVAVGSPFNDKGGSNAGHVQVFDFEKDEGSWVAFGKGLGGSYPNDEFGTAIALSGDGRVLAVGAVGREQGTGSVQVYRNINRRWEKLGPDIMGISENDNLGVTLSISCLGDRIIVSSRIHNKSTGYVQSYAFDESRDFWNQVGETLYGEGDGDNFGYSVSISGNGYRFAAGSRYFDPTPDTNSGGQVEVYEF